MANERLNKVIAASGHCSRRKADELIRAGKVRINGTTITDMGVKADPKKDEIIVEGKVLGQPEHVYVALNKPVGYISTTSDPHAKHTVLELASADVRLFPVGRLDKDTEGLILLTNDGAFTQRLSHPRYQVEREYEAELEGKLSESDRRKLEQGGLEIEGGLTGPSRIRILNMDHQKTRVQIVLREGRKRQIRLMFASTRNPVIKLKRTRFGKLRLGNLPSGNWRYVKVADIL